MRKIINLFRRVRQDDNMYNINNLCACSKGYFIFTFIWTVLWQLIIRHGRYYYILGWFFKYVLMPIFFWASGYGFEMDTNNGNIVFTAGDIASFLIGEMVVFLFLDGFVYGMKEMAEFISMDWYWLLIYAVCCKLGMKFSEW